MKGDYAGAAKWLSNDNKISHALVIVAVMGFQILDRFLFSFLGRKLSVLLNVFATV